VKPHIRSQRLNSVAPIDSEKTRQRLSNSAAICHSERRTAADVPLEARSAAYNANPLLRISTVQLRLFEYFYYTTPR
jgi:hypothetical protein